MMRAQDDHHETRRVFGGPGRARRGLAAALLGALALGCGPDPQGKYEEFLDETKDDRDVLATKEDFATIEGDISGDFLMAVSTTVDITLPLQFIVTNTVTRDEEGALRLKASLQPLSLDPQQVLTPRVPVGDPLVFDNLPIVDGKFVIDAGTVMVTGKANPITGGEIVATLKMTGSIMGEDLYCGTVTGDVMAPLMLSIEGSTFAAVRLTDKTALPTKVQIDCEGTTVPDMP